MKINFKVVERAGKKLIDTLHKSNSWENTVWERENCLPCVSSRREMKEAIKSCKRRSIIYQTWYQTCKLETKKEIEERMEQEIEANSITQLL